MTIGRCVCACTQTEGLCTSQKNAKQVIPETASKGCPTDKVERAGNLSSRLPQYSNRETSTRSTAPDPEASLFIPISLREHNKVT